MNKKSCISVLCIFLALHLFSQSDDDVYECLDYKWDDSLVIPVIQDQFKKSDAVVIKDYESVEVKFTKEMRSAKLTTFNVKHKIVLINTDAGIELFNTVSVPLEKKEKINSISARTISKDGKITMLDVSHIKEVDNHDGTIEKIFALEGLEKGGILEYVIKTYENYKECYTFYMQDRVPILHKQVVMISPEYIRYNFKTYNGDIKTIEAINEGKEKRITLKDFDYYEVKEVPALAFEDYCNYRAHLLRAELQFAYNYRYYRTDVRDKGENADLRYRFMTYNDLATSLYRTYYETKAKDLTPINSISDGLSLASLPTDEHIRKIENYVKSNILISYERSDDEFVPAEILKNKTTGLDNVIKLYLELFKKSNITCQLALTCDKNKKAFDPVFDSYAYTNKPLLYFPETNGYIDPLKPALRYPLCSSDYANNGVYVLNLKTKKTDPFSDYFYLSNISESDTINRIESLVAKLNLSPELDSVYMDITKSEPDYFAEDIRSSLAFAPASEKNEPVNKILGELMKDASIDKLTITNGELANADKPLIIEAHLSGSSLIEKSGHDRILKIGEAIGIQKNLYQETSRVNPIDLEYKHKLLRKIELDIPAGYKLSGLEALKKNVEFEYKEQKACGFISSYQLNGSKLTIDIEEYDLQTEFPAKVYNDFRKVINAAADFNKVALVLSK